MYLEYILVYGVSCITIFSWYLTLLCVCHGACVFPFFGYVFNKEMFPEDEDAFSVSEDPEISYLTG